MLARNNGKGMAAMVNRNEETYRLQLESEQRYAIGILPELREDKNSEQNQAVLSYISEHFDIEETEVSLIFGDFIRDHSPAVARKKTH